LPKFNRILALSGGIGSGKSTVAAYLAQLGLAHLDMDQVSRQVSKKGSVGLQQLCTEFGSGILTENSELDRKLLAQTCFASKEKTDKLNSIMHPLIWEASHQWQQLQQSDWVVFEIPLLLESNSMNRVDYVVMVLADLSLRKKRVIARGYQSSKDFDNIVQHQCSDEQRRQAAHFIIHNDQRLHMQNQCKELLTLLKVL